MLLPCDLFWGLPKIKLKYSVFLCESVYIYVVHYKHFWTYLCCSDADDSAMPDQIEAKGKISNTDPVFKNVFIIDFLY